MEAIIYRSDDTDVLDQMVQNFKLYRPLLNGKGERIGSVIKVWRDGCCLKADIECVPEDTTKFFGFKINV